MKKMDTLLRKNRELPLFQRVMEGGSTMMLLGYWYGSNGKIMLDPLSFVYSVHWISSLYNHLYPCYQSFLLDTYLIDLVAMERLVYINPDISNWIYACFVFFLLSNSNDFHPFVCFGKVLSCFLLIFFLHDPPFLYNLSFLLSAILYVLSDYAFYHSLQSQKGMAHVCFHMCITYGSYEEAFLYNKNYKQPFHFVRIIIYFLYFGKCLEVLKKNEKKKESKT